MHPSPTAPPACASKIKVDIVAGNVHTKRDAYVTSPAIKLMRGRPYSVATFEYGVFYEHGDNRIQVGDTVERMDVVEIHNVQNRGFVKCTSFVLLNPVKVKLLEIVCSQGAMASVQTEHRKTVLGAFLDVSLGDTTIDERKVEQGSRMFCLASDVGLLVPDSRDTCWEPDRQLHLRRRRRQPRRASRSTQANGLVRALRFIRDW